MACFVYATCCNSLVLITWLCTLKDPVSMILFYFMSLWYISIMNYKIRWTINVKIIQSRSGINYLWILINSIYNFGLFSISVYFWNLFLHTFDFLTLYVYIAYVNFKIDCMHIERQIYVTYKIFWRQTHKWMNVFVDRCVCVLLNCSF